MGVAVGVDDVGDEVGLEVDGDLVGLEVVGDLVGRFWYHKLSRFMSSGVQFRRTSDMVE